MVISDFLFTVINRVAAKGIVSFARAGQVRSKYFVFRSALIINNRIILLLPSLAFGKPKEENATSYIPLNRVLFKVVSRLRFLFVVIKIK